MHVYTTRTPEETKQIGARLAKQLSGGEVICLQGPLGSGKTTFVAGLIGHFLPAARVLSPTFTLIRQYQVFHPKIKHIYHLDLYRLKEQQEITNLGLEEYSNRQDSVVLIEWPEKIKKISAGKKIEIAFVAQDNSRHIVTCNSLRNYHTTVRGSNGG